MARIWIPERNRAMNEDEYEDWPGPIVVKRKVHDEGLKLDAARKPGDLPGYERARAKAAEYRDAGDSENAAFWDKVVDFLMTWDYAAFNTPIVVLEDGEEWDDVEGVVIRPGGQPPHDGKGAQ